MIEDTSTTSEAFEALLYQVLETEMGSEKVYALAVSLAINESLRAEWKRCLMETREHVQIARELLQQLGLDPDCDVAVRVSVRTISDTLLGAMITARDTQSKAEAEIVAMACVAETDAKDHMNCQLDLGYGSVSMANGVHEGRRMELSS